MTPEIKQLIQKRRKLFRAGRRDEYTAIAIKINREIYKRKRTYYRRKFPSKNPRWRSLVNIIRSPRPDPISHTDMIEALNDGFYSVWGAE